MQQQRIKQGWLKLGLAALLLGSVVALGLAGEPKHAAVKQYRGQIKSVKIDKCGLEPGTCEGSVILEQPDGREVTLAIEPGTWIQRGDQLVVISELGVGNYVTARAMRVPEQLPKPGTVGSSPGERTYLLEETARE